MKNLSLMVLFLYSLQAMDEGQLDTSFNPQGVVPGIQYLAKETIGSTLASTKRIAIGTDGAIYQPGDAMIGGVGYVVLTKYKRDGELDTIFNASGSIPGVTTPLRIGSSTSVNVATAQVLSTGEILVAGYAGVSPVFSLFIVRYKANGTLDTSFGSSGIVTQNFSTSTYIYDMKVKTFNGRIVLVGALDDGTNTSLLIAQYTAAGVLDTSFGSGTGYVTKLESGWTSAVANGLCFLSGDPIVVGYAAVGGATAYRTLIARFNYRGDYSTSFNSTGYNVIDISQSEIPSRWQDVAMQSDNKIVATGYYGVTDIRFPAYAVPAIARFLPTGVLDSTGFNTSGSLKGTNSLSITGVTYAVASGITVQANNQSIIGGYLYDGSNKKFFCARYKTDGTLDTTFNASGTQRGVNVLSFGSIASNAVCYGVAMQPDGCVILAGPIESSLFYDSGFGLARVIGLPVAVPANQDTDALINVTSIGLGSGWIDKANSFYALLRAKYYDWV